MMTMMKIMTMTTMTTMMAMLTMTMMTVMAMTTISDDHGQPLPIQSTSDRSLPRAPHTSLDQSNLHDYHWDLLDDCDDEDHYDCHIVKRTINSQSIPAGVQSYLRKCSSPTCWKLSFQWLVSVLFKNNRNLSACFPFGGLGRLDDFAMHVLNAFPQNLPLLPPPRKGRPHLHQSSSSRILYSVTRLFDKKSFPTDLE